MRHAFGVVLLALASTACTPAPHALPRRAIAEGDWIGMGGAPNNRLQVHLRLQRKGDAWTAMVDVPQLGAWGHVPTKVAVTNSHVELELYDADALPSEQRWRLVGDIGDRDHLRLTVVRAAEQIPIELARADLATPTTATLARVAGRYGERNSDGDVVVSKVGSHLLRVDLMTPVELFPGPKGTFRISADQTVGFEGDAMLKGGHRLQRRSVPYTVEELTIRAKVPLHATIRVPMTHDSATYPGIVWVSHSGPATGYDADAEALADYGARHGFAVLTYDKRGSGLSGGDWVRASLEDLADDALAALEALRGQPAVDPARVGLWSLSEGTWVAPMAAVKSGHAAFLVLTSASATSVADQALLSTEHEVRAGGGSQTDVDEAMTYARALASSNGVMNDSLRQLIAVDRKKPWAHYSTILSVPFEDVEPFLRRVAQARDHEATLGRLRCPVLAIWGDRDTVFPPVLNQPLMERNLRAGGNTDVTTRVFPNAPHSFRAGRFQPDARFDFTPGYLDEVMAWLAPRFRK